MRKTFKQLFFFPLIFTLLGLLGLSGCGYTFQHPHNPLIEKYGVRKIYVTPLRNDSYKPGVENLVYNELVRIIVANRRVQVVSSKEDADAILSGEVIEAIYMRAGATTADQLYPTSTGTKNWVPKVSGSVIAATSYSAQLVCQFALKIAGSGKSIWASGFSRSKDFQANNQIGTFGTTSSLVNESEFDRALLDMARNMMADVHESMLAMF